MEQVCGIFASYQNDFMPLEKKQTVAFLLKQTVNAGENAQRSDGVDKGNEKKKAPS